MEEEHWKDIEGYEGLYQISDLGRVKSLTRDVIMGRGGLYHLHQRLLKTKMNRGGYLYVNLCKNGKCKSCKVHRLVAEAFLGNPDNLPQVNHINEDKTNNCIDNLEWRTVSYNMRYGTRAERASVANSKPVQQFSKDGRLIAVWPSATDAQRATRIDKSSICNCCKDKLHSAGGFIWRYEE